MAVRVKFFRSIARANLDELEEQVNNFVADVESAGGRVIDTQFSAVVENQAIVLFALVTYDTGDASARLGAMTAAIDDPTAVRQLAETIQVATATES